MNYRYDNLYWPYIPFLYQTYYLPQIPKYISFIPCPDPERPFPERPSQKLINQYRYLHNLHNDEQTWYILEQREGRNHTIPEAEEDGDLHVDATSPFAPINYSMTSDYCRMTDITILYEGERKWNLIMISSDPYNTKIVILFFIHSFGTTQEGITYANGHYYNISYDTFGRFCIPENHICFRMID
ncbi:hypothetical protein ACMGD3_07395 [Lysinibacillus sphaericus]|uniref:hypothetical protein n=1 Tax=Lysinibacillus sphaericus TaxID=1421 RepID=UPI001C5DD7DA